MINTHVVFKIVRQYQMLAEPIIQPVILALDINKWFLPLSEPKRIKKSEPHHYPSLFLFEKLDFNIWTPEGKHQGDWTKMAKSDAVWTKEQKFPPIMRIPEDT